MADPAGALRFARYALPPNRLGYCGPHDTGALFEQAVALGAGRAGGPTPVGRAGAAERDDLVVGLGALARGFEGAWPYLELIAGANGVADPLDDPVVAAYWLGGPMLDGVRTADLGRHAEDRFRARAGRWWAEVSGALAAGARPSHAMHVMVVGPWVGMLRSGRVEAPLQVMDRCRVRWGVVREVMGDIAVVEASALEVHGGALCLGAARPEEARLGESGAHPCGPVAVGDVVALHWDWVCEVLDGRSLGVLRREHALAVAAANAALAVPGAAELG